MRGDRDDVRPARRSIMRWLRALTLRTLVLFGLAIVASIAFVVIAAELRRGALDQLDIAIELAVHRIDSPLADVVMKTATWIGSNPVVMPVTLAVTLVAIHRRQRLIAIVLVIDALVVVGAYVALKLLFSRARPRLFDKIELPTDYSFPSGHSMSAVGIYGVVAAALIAMFPRSRAPVVAVTAALIATIGFSRVYLGVHWPFDVLAGYAGGVPPLVVAVHLIHRRALRDRNVAEVIEHQG